ncbi:arginine/serine-rich protein 1 isoform X2 [Solea solea]|uniref:arginine/serine-rich protein 1 isoform X2 n=1 Tax=Solea solea TaxID=90069 RepID=UPI002729D880|nr:arginine/serine-rich protein 1 isoform X2 [Solea solea]
MAKEEGSHSEMAHARWSDGINVIFDQNSPASLRSCSRSSSGSGSNRSAESDQHRALGHRKRHYRSSSSSSSRSRSTPRTRSRSRPRCNRPSSRCRCDNHHRHRRAHHRRSHAHRVRAHPRSVSRSPSPDRYSHRRSNRSRSSSNSHKKRHQRTVGRFDSRVSRSPVDSYRSHSRSGSSSSSLSLSLEDKQELLVAAKTIATKSLDVEHLQLPESVQPILLEVIESQRRSSKPETRVRQGPERTASQSHEAESDDISNPTSPPRKKEISFSINNSIAKPIVAAPSLGKVTSRVDSFGRRKPYGHWVPVKSRHFC